MSRTVFTGLTQLLRLHYVSGPVSNFAAAHVVGLSGLPAAALELPVALVNATATSLIMPPVHGSNTWSPGEIADGDSVVRNITVPGAAFGDRVTVGYSASVGGCSLTGYVLSADTVQAVMSNTTGSAVTPSDGTVYATVERVRIS